MLQVVRMFTYLVNTSSSIPNFAKYIGVLKDYIIFINVTFFQMYAPVSFQASIILHLTLESFSQFLPPSIFQQQPGPVSPMIMPPSMQMSPYPQQRLPVMVMPYHSKAADKKYLKRKNRKPKYYEDSESYSDSESCSSSNEYLRSHKRGHRKKKRQVLTPVISYVTRNGRVVYQKKIKKENAGDWLEIVKDKVLPKYMEREKESGEMTIGDLKHKYGLKKHHHHNDK